MTYDASRDADRIRNLQAVSDTMTARAARYEAELTKYKSGRSGRSAWLWFFALLALAEGAIILRLRKSSGSVGCPYGLCRLSSRVHAGSL
jgi:hypothetical protein